MWAAGQGVGAALCNMKMSESVRILIDRTDNGEDVTRAGAACLGSVTRVTVTWPRDTECHVVT